MFKLAYVSNSLTYANVTRGCRPGLFGCHDVPDLSRTDDDLEQMFGSQRYHERRATGRKAASPAVVLRGEVRLIATTPPSCASLTSAT